MGKLKVISFEEKDAWNKIVTSFTNYDVYYLHQYVSAFRYAGDGIPFLIYYYSDTGRLCYTVLRSDIADHPGFFGTLKSGCYYDFTTPYGYGGPLIENCTDEEIRDFFALLSNYCNANGIISQFIRFHPLLKNEQSLKDYCDLCQMKKTVVIDTSDSETIYANLEPRCRGAIQKAKQNDIEIKIDNSERAKSEFLRLYLETMQQHRAKAYYFFNPAFFNDFFQNMKGNYQLVYATLDGKIITSALIMHGNMTMHYHLSGSDRAYRQLSANNLLLYTAACWGADNGYKKFHLGGGLETDDSLFLFKKSFNKKGLLNFYIGRNIFSPEKFQELIRQRAACDVNFDPDSSFMISYRA